jgi:hypothetical protein
MRNSEFGILFFTARQRRAQYKSSCLRRALWVFVILWFNNQTTPPFGHPSKGGESRQASPATPPQEGNLSCLRNASSQIQAIENHPKNLRKSASSAVKKVLKNQRFELAVRYAIGTNPLFLRAKRGKN